MVLKTQLHPIQWEPVGLAMARTVGGWGRRGAAQQLALLLEKQLGRFLSVREREERGVERGCPR